MTDKSKPDFITFKSCKYNHGNKGPSKSGFDLTVSTDSNDWFYLSGSYMCKGFKITNGRMFGEEFTFEVLSENSFKFIFVKSGQEFVENTPQLLLKTVYPKRSLSSNAMFVFGAAAVQKIASLFLGKEMDTDKRKQFNDDYYNEAR